MIPIGVTYPKRQANFCPGLNGHIGGRGKNPAAGLKDFMMIHLPKCERFFRFLTVLIIAFWARTAVADLASYPVVIQTPEGNQSYYLLELAATPAARQKGLMDRYDLGIAEGMLFVWPEEDYRSFWMKNTPISLDILFFSSELTQVSRHENTVPFSTTRLPSGKPTRYVVELRAGQAKLQGLKTGSLLILPEVLMRALDSQS